MIAPAAAAINGEMIVATSGTKPDLLHHDGEAIGSDPEEHRMAESEHATVTEQEVEGHRVEREYEDLDENECPKIRHCEWGAESDRQDHN